MKVGKTADRIAQKLVKSHVWPKQFVADLDVV